MSDDRTYQASKEAPGTMQSKSGESLRRRQRWKNLALLAVLLSFVALVYGISLVRMGEQ